MADAAATKQLEASPQTPPQNNPFVFLCNIPQFLLNSLMNFNKKIAKKLEGDKSVRKADDAEQNSAKNPDVVSFPLTKQPGPPIKLEGEDIKEDTNPIILWQVYALGGFIVLKWAWGKWQEMKAKDKEDSPDEDNPPADPPADE